MKRIKLKPRKGYTRHHRRPVSLGGVTSDRNCIYLRKDKHVAWHIIVGNSTVYEIARILNEQYIDPDFELVVRRRT